MYILDLTPVLQLQSSQAQRSQVQRLLVRHPLYNDGVMLNMVHYAILLVVRSSLSTESATATFMLLPNWKGLSANAYMQIFRECPEH